MTKLITDHQNAAGIDSAITISADDPDPKYGNASHVYTMEYGDTASVLRFQHGPVKENGVNGVTNETLIAIVIDRLRGFQSGPFSCRENAVALTKLEESLHWLQSRTRARLARGVEGTNQK